ncbi:hypothetical protein WH47_00034, partial [Habropoda laboriosa]
NFNRPIREFLNNIFRSRCTGRRPEPHLWPPRSPDLDPLDFFLSRAVKEFAYRSGQQIKSMQELKTRITEVFHRLQNMPDIHRRIRSNIEARLQACLQNNGGHVEV